MSKLTNVASSSSKPPTKEEVDAAKSSREFIESIVIAIVLAFLFRAFEAEAFVIPTGSMAPTLQGRHKDITCPECGYEFQAGASLDAEAAQGSVEAVTCPMCYFEQEMDPRRGDHFSHTGDRILVNKFAYEAPFGQPERWDVFVFKYPGNAKQNYIKRLVGLPNETLMIRHGDILVRPASGEETEGGQAEPQPFQIARKSPDKLKHMLQLVHDTNYLSETLQEVEWPLNWQSPSGQSSAWSSPDRGETYLSEATADEHWLHYRQYLMDYDVWSMLGRGLRGEIEPIEVPITDFYAYNAQTRRIGVGFERPLTIGLHWVGDLAVEAEAEVSSNDGTLSLVLIEAGRRHLCQFDVATGNVTLSIDEGTVPFVDDAGNETPSVTAPCDLQGPGNYQIRFANVDNQLVLWVNDELVEFDQPTTYGLTPNDRPTSGRSDPGDLHPVRIGTKQCAVKLNRLRVLRDIYYIAVNSLDGGGSPIDYAFGTERQLEMHLISPENWQRGDVFDKRKEAVFPLAEDQFFALGDNSPYSRDSRMWGNEYYVERDLLIGKALLIYWPHAARITIPGTNTSIPAFPNFRKMGLIH
jgi:signal peptidase I